MKNLELVRDLAETPAWEWPPEARDALLAVLDDRTATGAVGEAENRRRHPEEPPSRSATKDLSSCTTPADPSLQA